MMKYLPADKLSYERRKYGMPYGLDYGVHIADNFRKVDFDKLRKYRVERAKAQLEKDGLGAMLVFENWNVRYVTSWSVLPYARSYPRNYALITRNGDPHLWVSGMRYETDREELPWLKGNVKCARAPFVRQSEKAFTHSMEKEIADILYEHGVNNEPLGIDSVSGFSLWNLQEGFKNLNVKLVDGQDTMFEARRIKSQEEIELIRFSHVLAFAAHAEAAANIRPGISENELAGLIYNKLLSMGSEYVDALVVASGENTNPNRRCWGDRIIRQGDMLFIDIVGSQFCGYRTCVYRDYTCGKATDEQKEMYRACYDMQYAGMNVIKAGCTYGEFMDQWPTPEHWGYTPEEQDAVTENEVAHGIGLCQYDAPRITRPIANATPDAKLMENEVVAVEVWEGVKGGTQGCRIEEVVAVKKDGYDLLTIPAPKEITECWV